MTTTDADTKNMSKDTAQTATLDLSADDETTAAETTAIVIRPRADDESILPAENWCPFYVYYNGTKTAKFNDSQIEGIARAGVDRGWCNLCDAPLVGDREQHVRAHLRQLRKWRKSRVAVIDKDRVARLAEARKARKAERDAEAIAESGVSRPTKAGRKR